jgi:hypothetical protein
MILLSEETVQTTMCARPIRAAVTFFAIVALAVVNPGIIWLPAVVLLALLTPFLGPKFGGLHALVVFGSLFFVPTVIVGIMCLMASRKWWIVPACIVGCIVVPIALKYAFAFAVWAMHGVPMDMVISS